VAYWASAMTCKMAERTVSGQDRGNGISRARIMVSSNRLSFCGDTGYKKGGRCTCHIELNARFSVDTCLLKSR